MFGTRQEVGADKKVILDETLTNGRKDGRDLYGNGNLLQDYKKDELSCGSKF